MNNELFDSGNILETGEDLFGFEDTETGKSGDSGTGSEKPDTKETSSAEDTFDEDSLFGETEDPDDEVPESVGENKDNKAGKEAPPTEGDKGSSPEGYNPYSSFARALHGDGLFQNLDEKTVDGITDADTFFDAIEAEVNSRLDEKTKRVNEALEAGVQVDVVRQYETTLNQLDGIEEDKLSAENEEGKRLRTAILRQDYLNRGFSKERAAREVQRIMNAGTDIDDAKEALESVKDYFRKEYDKIIDERKSEDRKEKEKIREESAAFKKALLETDKLFGEIPVDKATRQKAYDFMTKVVKTYDDGEKVTAVQLYADEHPVEFRTMLGIVAALTDGFKKPTNIFNKTVDKKVRSNLAQIEARVSGSRPKGGSNSFAGGDWNEDDSSSRRKGGWRLDI